MYEAVMRKGIIDPARAVREMEVVRKLGGDPYIDEEVFDAVVLNGTACERKVLVIGATFRSASQQGAWDTAHKWYGIKA
jgi:hypothetical protein